MSRRARVSRWSLLGGLILVAALGTGAWVFGERSTSAESSTNGVPTLTVERGSMSLDVHLDGELRAARSTAIAAPAVGGALRILTMRETGTAVHAGDVVMEFDPAEQQYALEQALSEVEEAEQEIRKREADVAVQLAQDKVTLLTAQFDVRRAELDAQVDPELMAANEIKIRQLSLEEARRRLTQVEQDVTSRATTAQSGLTVLNERRAKSQLNADRARQNIDTLVLTAPIDGVVMVRENRDASGGIFFSGMSLPEWLPGDTAYAGRPMFDIFDPGGMEIRATVNEQERANLSIGQAASVDLKSASGRTLAATITSIGSLGRVTGGPLRVFDVTLTLSDADADLRPGTTVSILVTGQQVDDVISVPKQAIFDKDGASQVYVNENGEFVARQISILHRNESRVAIEGVTEGEQVALIDPVAAAAAATPSGTTATPGAAPAGGGL